MPEQRIIVNMPNLGLNTRDPAHDLDPRQTPEMLNLNVKHAGRVFTRLGKEKYSAAIYPVPGTSKDGVKALCKIEDYTYVSNGQKIYVSFGGDWVQLLSFDESFLLPPGITIDFNNEYLDVQFTKIDTAGTEGKNRNVLLVTTGKTYVFALYRRDAFKGEWETLTPYAKDEVVYFATKYYKSLQDGNTSHMPSLEPTPPVYWVVVADSFDPVVSFPAWNNTTSYFINDKVSYGGKTYIAIKSVIYYPPPAFPESNINKQPDISPKFWEVYSVTAIDHPAWAVIVPNVAFQQFGLEDKSGNKSTHSYATIHDNRLWLLKKDGTLHCSGYNSGKTVYLDFFNFTLTTPTNLEADGSYFLLSKPNDFEYTGLRSQKGGLTLFTGNSIVKAIGNPSLINKVVNFNIRYLYEEAGCVATNSIQNIDNKLVFLSFFKGIYRIMCIDDTGTIHDLSDHIYPTLQAINPTMLKYVCSAVYDDKYIITLPTEVNVLTEEGLQRVTQYITLKLILKSLSFELNSAGISCSQYYHDPLSGSLLGSGIHNGTDNCYIYQMETGTTDDGVKIVSYFKTMEFMGVLSRSGKVFNYLKVPERIKLIKNIETFVKATNTGAISMNIFVDNQLYPANYELQTGIKNGLTKRHETLPINADTKGSGFQLKFGKTDNSWEMFESYMNIEVMPEFISK